MRRGKAAETGNALLLSTHLSIQMSTPLREHPHVNIESSGHNPLETQETWFCGKPVTLKLYHCKVNWELFTVSTTLPSLPSTIDTSLRQWLSNSQQSPPLDLIIMSIWACSTHTELWHCFWTGQFWVWIYWSDSMCQFVFSFINHFVNMTGPK